MKGPGGIVFDNVTFGYVPEREILKGISFEIPAGKKVAFVGPSGYSKSILYIVLLFIVAENQQSCD